MSLLLVRRGCWRCSTMRGRSQVGSAYYLHPTLQEDNAVHAGGCSIHAVCTIVECTLWALELSPARAKL